MTYEARAAQSELEHHRSMSLVAARLGLLARDLRQENAQQSDTFGAPTELMRRQQRIVELQNLLRHTWHAQMSASEALGYSNRHVPIQSRGVFEHVRADSITEVIHSCQSTIDRPQRSRANPVRSPTSYIAHASSTPIRVCGQLNNSRRAPEISPKSLNVFGRSSSWPARSSATATWSENTSSSHCSWQA